MPSQCSCGVINTNQAKFCKGCGSAIKILTDTSTSEINQCTSCKAPLKIGAYFCNKCGAKSVATPADDLKLEPVISATEKTVRSCKFCNAALKSNAKFCGSCGQTTNESFVPAMPLKPESIKATTESLPNLNQLKSAGGRRNNRMKIALISAGVIAVSGLSWVGVNAYTKPSAISSLTQATKAISSATTKLVPTPLPPKIIPAAIPPTDEATLVPASPLNSDDNGALSANNYIGKVVKIHTVDHEVVFDVFDKLGQFMVLRGEDTDNFRSKIILVTDHAGLVIDAKDVTQEDQVLMTGKNSCQLNKKPYTGIYAAVSINSILTPSNVWTIDPEGKLSAKTIDGILCGVTKYYEGEDVFYRGINEQQKSKIVAAKPIKQDHSNLNETSSNIKNQQKPATSSVKQPEIIHQAQTKPQEPVNQPDQKGAQDDSFNGLLNKLGESMKNNGAKEHICSSNERAMNQCQ